MYLLPHDDWMRLARHEGEPCVTLVVPLSPSDPDREAVALRLRHAVEEADRRLESMGMEDDRRSKLLAPVGYGDNPADIPRDGNTLLALLSPSISEVYHLDAALDTRVELTEHFVLSDLQAALDQPERWHLLTLADDGAELYEIHRGTPRKAELPLERNDRQEANAERLSPTPGGPLHARGNASSTKATNMTPQGFGQEQVDDIEREAWYRVVDKALQSVLQPAGDPLVVLADTRHQGPFAAICHVDDIVAVHQHPEDLTDDRIREIGRSLQDGVDTERLTTHWHNAESRTTSLQEALQGARSGRVELLMWNPEARIRHVDEHEDAPAAAADMLDEVVRQTSLHGGRVIPVPPEHLPEPGNRREHVLNAVLRW